MSRRVGRWTDEWVGGEGMGGRREDSWRQVWE